MKHQIVCAKTDKDFYSGEDKFGVLSADGGFSLPMISSLVENSRYTPVQIPQGVELTEALCGVMPRSFTYSAIGDERVYMQNTFTGKCGEEYDSVAHWIIPSDRETEMPIEYYLSPSFVTSKEQVSEGYMKISDMAVGSYVNVNKVMKFISDGRGEVFAQLVKQVLICRRNGQRIIIADTPDNIPLWIGAVCYALPRCVSKNITFCTYASSPDSVSVDICGVLPEGTEYSPDKLYENAVIFDTYAGIYPDNDPCDRYYDFLINGMTHDHASIDAFNEFVQRNFSFTEPCYDICIAYTLYTLLNDGIAALHGDDHRACRMLLDRCSPAVSVKLSEKLCTQASGLAEMSVSTLKEMLELLILPYRVCSHAHREEIRQTVCQTLLMSMLRRDVDEGGFKELTSSVKKTATNAGFSLSGELMAQGERKKLTAILTYDPTVWKAELIFSLLLEYLTDNKKEYEALSADSPLGRFVCDIVTSGKKANTSLPIARAAIKCFSHNNILFTSAYSRCVSVLEGEDIEQLRADMAKICAEGCIECRYEVYDYFVHLEDYETLYAVFEQMMKCSDIEFCSRLFTEQCNDYFSTVEDYAAKYFIPASELYYALAKNNGRVYTAETSEIIFSAINKRRVVTPSCEEIVANIASRIPLVCPDGTSRAKLEELEHYLKDVKSERLGGRLLSLAFGIECERIDNVEDYYKTKSALEELTREEKVVLLACGEEEWQQYFKWVLPIFTPLGLDENETAFIYDRFMLTPEQRAEFCRAFTKEYLRDGRDGDYTNFYNFLAFLFDNCGENEREEVASIIKRLNSKRLEALCAGAEDAFDGSVERMDSFNALLSMPVKRSGFFGTLFKKK